MYAPPRGKAGVTDGLMDMIRGPNAVVRQMIRDGKFQEIAALIFSAASQLNLPADLVIFYNVFDLMYVYICLFFCLLLISL